MRIPSDGKGRPVSEPAARSVSSGGHKQLDKAGRDHSHAVVVSPGVGAAGAKADQTELAAQARVAEVANALRNGNYKVDFEKLASRLLDEEAARASKA